VPHGVDTEGTGARIFCIAASGSRAVTGDEQGRVTVWDVGRERPLRTVPAHTAPIVSIAIARDGRFAVTGAADGSSHLVDLDRGELAGALRVEGAPVRSVALSPDDKLAALGSDDGAVHLHEIVAVGKPPRRLWGAPGHRAQVGCVALAPGGRLLTAGQGDQSCRIWDVAAERETARLEDPRGP